MADPGIPSVALKFQVFDPLDFMTGRRGQGHEPREADWPVDSMAKRPLDAASRASSYR